MRTTTFKRRRNHPPEVVWHFLADLRNDVTWRGEVIRVELAAGAPYIAGATYLEHVEWEGIEAEASLVVTEVVDGSRLVVVADDPSYRSVFTWQFIGDSSGTDLLLEMTLEASGTMRLVEPFLWAILNRWLERDLETLDEMIDSDSAA